MRFIHFILLITIACSAAATQAPPDLETLCTFEEGASDRPHQVKHSTAKSVPDGAVGDRHLEWSYGGKRLWYRLRFKLDLDLTHYSRLIFHSRAGAGTTGLDVKVRFRCAGGTFSIALPEAGPAWQRHEIPLLAFERMGRPDRTKARYLELFGYASGQREVRVLHLDDIALFRSPKGWMEALPRRIDFEAPLHSRTVQARFSTKKVVKDGKRGQVLSWILPAGKEMAYLDFPLVPSDIRKYARLRFRLRANRPLPSGTLTVRVYDVKNSHLGLDLKDLGSDWIEASLPLGYFYRSGSFDPTAVAYLEWIVFDTKAVTFFLDDIEWMEGNAGASSWQKGRGPVVDLANPETLYAVVADHSTARLGSGKKRGGVLEWEVSVKKPWVCLNINNLPRDIQSYRALVLKVKADRKLTGEEIHVRLSSSDEEYLSVWLPPVGKKWKKIVLPLPDFLASKSLDPTGIQELELVGWALKPVKISFTHVGLEKGKRGTASWRPTGKELMARIFGKRRASKVRRVKTKYFQVLTDSRAALGKFLRKLDGHVDFARKVLDLTPPRDPIPVYIFRNPEGYHKFCVDRVGFTEDHARATAGIGCGRYFATYYTQPDSPTIVHELAHTLVHRVYGAQGGSWLHEGFAVYVERAFKNRNVVKEFSVHLSNRKFMPLKEFITREDLVSSTSRKDASIVGRLYQQAGAFFAFLKDGPFKEKFPEMVKTLTRAYTRPSSRARILEKLYGKSLKDLEKTWIQWGSREGLRKRKP